MTVSITSDLRPETLKDAIGIAMRISPASTFQLELEKAVREFISYRVRTGFTEPTASCMQIIIGQILGDEI